MSTTLARYDQREVELLGQMWKATREAQTLRVEVRTHPMGWELRAIVDKEVHRSFVIKSEADVFTVSEAWKAEAITKGWSCDCANDIQ